MYITEFINDAAEDCIQNMSDQEKETLIQNPNPIDYHFTLGLYIRNTYVYKEKSLLEESCLHPDDISDEIIKKILSMLLPEYIYRNTFIERLYSNKKFIELRKEYKTIYGKYPVEIVKRHEDTMEKVDLYKGLIYEWFDGEKTNYEEYYKMFKKEYQICKKEIYKTINELAELVFRQAAFRKKAEELGIAYGDISEKIKHLKRIFYQKGIYIPLDVCLILFKEKIEKKHYVEYRKELTKKILEYPSLIEELDKSYFMDRVLARTALKCSWALNCLPMYQDDEKMVKYCLKQDGEAIEFASKRFQENREWVKYAIEHAKKIMDLECMEPYRKDKELVYLACERFPENLLYVDELYQDDFELAKMCIKKKTYTGIFCCLSDRLRDNKELVMLDLEESPNVEAYSERLRDDDDIAEKLYILHGPDSWGWYYMSERLQDKYNIKDWDEE